jgi:hypothetical protein
MSGREEKKVGGRDAAGTQVPISDRDNANEGKVREKEIFFFISAANAGLFDILERELRRSIFYWSRVVTHFEDLTLLRKR